MADLEITAGDTEPFGWDVGITSDSELTSSDIDSAELYAQEEHASTVHVNGASLTVDSVSSTQNDDGTWDTTVNVTFDPVDNGPGGDNAFATGDEGTYEAYTRVVWSDSDDTRHPNDSKRIWEVLPNFES